MSGRLKYYLKLLCGVAGAIYTGITVLLSFWSWEQVGITGNCCKAWILFGVILISAFISWLILIKTNKRTVWKKGNSAIILRYGDLHSIAFPTCEKKKNSKRIVLISMNTHFDTLVNNRVVSETSVHGKWINWMKDRGVCPKNLSERIQKAAAEQGIKPIRIDKKEGNAKAYQRGTIVELDFENTRFFLLALSEFDENLNAQTDRDQIIEVIKNICNYYDKHGEGHPMWTPLIGTELSRANISEYESLMIMKSIFQLYSEKIHNELSIVVYKKHRNQVSIFE